jgi:hypothetical protein
VPKPILDKHFFHIADRMNCGGGGGERDLETHLLLSWKGRDRTRGVVIHPAVTLAIRVLTAT